MALAGNSQRRKEIFYGGPKGERKKERKKEEGPKKKKNKRGARGDRSDRVPGERSPRRVVGRQCVVVRDGEVCGVE